MPAKKTKQPLAPVVEQVADQHMRLELVSLDDLRPDPKNPKQHDAALIRQSIEDDGFCDPPALDERTGLLVEGHGRVEVLRAMRASGAPAPKRVVDGPGGIWLVPVVRGLRFETDDDRRRYLLRHNRLTEVGGWDTAALADMLTERRNVDLDDGLGWSSKELDKVVQVAAHERALAAGIVEDEAPEPPKDPVTRLGDRWILGRHVLVCGDCREDGVVAGGRAGTRRWTSS